MRQALPELSEAGVTDQAASLPLDLSAADSAFHGSFGDYELLEEIAHGGMGIVYKAQQKSLDRIVAVKVMLPGRFALPDAVKRFQTEAEVVAKLQHPNIVAIHEVGVHEGQHYFSMDYVAGRTLADIVRDGALAPKRAGTYLKTIAEAVHYAHQHGILHRDLKPSNVLIDASDQPRITDFGLAKVLTGDSELTLTGQVLGSPNYLAPEQAGGRHAEVGPASEVYALGAMLYHLVTGRPPFQAESLTTLLRQVIETDPVAPRLLNPSIPRDLETICLKCLEKEIPRRYPSAQALADDLDRFLSGKPVLARPVGPSGKVWRWCRRRPVRAGLIAALVVVSLAGAWGVLREWQQAEQQRARAEQQRVRAEDNALSALRSSYAADIKLAQYALEDHTLGLAASLLNKYRREQGAESRPAATARQRGEKQKEIDLRGWEWRYLWKLCQSQETSRLHQYSASVNGLAVSRDGQVLAVLACGQPALWDLTTKRLKAELEGFGSTRCLALSSIGSLLAFGGLDTNRQARIVLWDVNAARVRRTLNHSSPSRALALSPEGKLLASFDDDGTIQVVDWESNQTLTNFTVPQPRRGGAGVLAFSPDGSRLAIGQDYGVLTVLDCQTGATVPIETRTKDGIIALAFSSQGEFLAAGFGFASGLIRLWDASSGALRSQFTNHTSWVSALAFTPDGQFLASASMDCSIRVWRLADGTEFRCFWGHADRVHGLAALPDSRTLVSGGKDGAVCFWDITASRSSSGPTNLTISFGIDSGAEVDVPSLARGRGDPKLVRRLGLAFTPDSRRFITSDREGWLNLWDGPTLRPIERLSALGSNNWGVALSPDGRWLATGETAGKVHLWDWPAQRALTHLDVPFEWLGDLRFSRSGRFLLANVIFNDHSTSLKIWRSGDWAELPLGAIQLERATRSDLSPDDRVLAVGYTDGVRLWSFPPGQPVAQPAAVFPGPGVQEVRFSPDGRTLVSVGGSVKVWDARARRELATLRGHSDVAYGAAFSPDGTRLATGGISGKDGVRLWDLATHRELLHLPADAQFFEYLSFSPDGNTMVATSLSGFAHLWRAPSWEEIAAAEKRQEAP